MRHVFKIIDPNVSLPLDPYYNTWSSDKFIFKLCVNCKILFLKRRPGVNPKYFSDTVYYSSINKYIFHYEKTSCELEILKLSVTNSITKTFVRIIIL